MKGLFDIEEGDCNEKLFPWYDISENNSCSSNCIGCI